MGARSGLLRWGCPLFDDFIRGCVGFQGVLLVRYG